MKNDVEEMLERAGYRTEPAKETPPPQRPDCYVVDTGNGILYGPFATLNECQTLMEAYGSAVVRRVRPG